MEKYGWIIFIIVWTANIFVIRKRAQESIDTNPELEKDYNDLLKGMLLFNIPWIIMGAGILSGSVQGMNAYSLPRQFNGFVAAFHICLLLLLALAARWIYFKNGAKFLEEHPAIFTKAISEAQVKFYGGLMLLAAVSSQLFMWSGFLPGPHK